MQAGATEPAADPQATGATALEAAEATDRAPTVAADPEATGATVRAATADGGP
ncbi:hypothetical protein GCM10010347_56460 [Streptomyces cirratus]|uniref:Uncharacterized protein n=1 Tax=Streptomyces cirratus TaxID=68187 RepID=A0ABQ3F088_9ACTN|nr:hypothetical protein [Streptomyces cirratus]GHB78760.1 hypothetical protein GCM10010347_56460 [Streptomyces cirratus]